MSFILLKSKLDQTQLTVEDQVPGLSSLELASDDPCQQVVDLEKIFATFTAVNVKQKAKVVNSENRSQQQNCVCILGRPQSAESGRHTQTSSRSFFTSCYLPALTPDERPAHQRGTQEGQTGLS